MKNLIKLVVAVCMAVMIKSCNIYSQGIIGNIGDTITIASYAGVWKWETENESLTFYLKDTTWIWVSKEFTDIIGTYRYVKDGQVVVDNTSTNPSSVSSPLRMPIYAGVHEIDENGNIWRLDLRFLDTITGKESSYEDSSLSYTVGKKGPELHINLIDEIKWYDGAEDDLARTPEEAARLKAKSRAARLPGWSIPNNVTLTKVN